MTAKDLPTPATLRKLLSYKPDTGLMTWKRRPLEMFRAARDCNSWNAKHAGRAAFTATNARGYRQGAIFGKLYYAHRVAYAIHHGEWPAKHIDHVNGGKVDNRIANLRDVTPSTNARNAAMWSNNTSGACGVEWVRCSGKWRARIGFHGKSVHLGYFENFEDAVAARKAFEAVNGFTDRHGRPALD
tara:strand:+ start:158 stop:715 length:558 start_codon:yes stop_codon:yes gene_type:complete